MNTVTMVGIVSIAIGFFCVLGAFYTFQKSRNRTLPVILGIAAFVFLTFIPVICAVFFAAPSNGY